MSKSNKAVKSVTIIIVFTIASKILGFIREALIAAKFGSGVETDAFFVASTTVGLFSSMITSAINTTTIPVLSQIEELEGKVGKAFHTSNLLNIVIVVSLCIVVTAWLFAPGILYILAFGFSAEQMSLAIGLTKIGVFSILFAAVIGVFRGYLQSESMFLETSLSGFALNAVYIIFLLFLTKNFGIMGLMTASVLAAFAQFLIQIPEIKRVGYRYRCVFDLHDKYVKQMLYLVPPVLGTVVINDINLIIDRALASTLIEGSISALNYANRLEALVTSVFIAAIITVIFPMLSKEANNNTYDGLKQLVIKGLNIGLIITIPATIGIILLADSIVEVAFQRGAFDNTAKIMTSGALIFYALGLAGNGARMLLYRVFYSLQDTRTPLLNGVFAVFINIVLNIMLIKFLQHRGLALATSISSTITAILLILGLRKKIGAFGFSTSLKCGIKSLLASVIMGVVVVLFFDFLNTFLGQNNTQTAIKLFASVSIGMIIYFGLLLAFKVEEAKWLIGIIKQKIDK